MLVLLLACRQAPDLGKDGESPSAQTSAPSDSASESETGAAPDLDSGLVTDSNKDSGGAADSDSALDTEAETGSDTRDTGGDPVLFDDGSICPELYGADDGQVPTWLGVCDASQGFLLRDGRCYALVEFTGYWADARASCAAAGGHLATMTSQDEADALEDLLALAYLGACDSAVEGTWAWITGEPWDWTDWRDGEPNDLSDEDCLQGDAREPHWFNDIWCDAASPFGEDYLCEFEGVTACRDASGVLVDCG